MASKGRQRHGMNNSAKSNAIRELARGAAKSNQSLAKSNRSERKYPGHVKIAAADGSKNPAKTALNGLFDKSQLCQTQPNSPGNAWVCGLAAKSLNLRECMADDAVAVEPVWGGNSLLTGKRTGTLRDSTFRSMAATNLKIKYQRLMARFP